jgi:hypothetical protein
VCHDHRAMRAAAGGGFIVILRYFETSFVMASVSSFLKAADRERTSVSTARVEDEEMLSLTTFVVNGVPSLFR